MKQYREGDTVFYHKSPGVVVEGSIQTVYPDGDYSLNGNEFYFTGERLYSAREEAEDDISPEGKLMLGSLKDAGRILSKSFPNVPIKTILDYDKHLFDIAFKLFDLGGRKK